MPEGAVDDVTSVESEQEPWCVTLQAAHHQPWFFEIRVQEVHYIWCILRPVEPPKRTRLVCPSCGEPVALNENRTPRAVVILVQLMRLPLVG